MQPPKAFPKNNFLQNIKKFNASPQRYMQEAMASWGTPVDLNLGKGMFILVAHPDQAQHVLAINHENYQKGKGYKQVAKILGQGLLTAEGEFWKKQRKLLQPSFHKPELKKLLPAVWETSQQYLDGLEKEQNLRLDTEMSGLTLTVLLNSLINYEDEELKEKMTTNITFGQEFIVNRIRSIVKWPLWLPTAMNRRYHQVMEESNRLIQKCVDDRISVGEKEVNDILSVLIEHHDPVEGFDQIRDELLTFLVAGHETSALGMTWTLHLLAHYPEVQQKLFEEVKSLEKLEDLDMMNFSNLRYTQNVIKESMRMYPPIWQVVRHAKGDDEIGGYAIKEGQQVMVNFYELHHHQDFWNNPDEFNPDRFDQGELKHKFQYLPFGAGPRFCIGNNFAMFEMVILLAQFIRAFKLTPISPRDIEFNPLLTLRPKMAVEINLERR